MSTVFQEKRLVAWFGRIMLSKLRQHSGQDWNIMPDPDFFMARLLEEYRELDHAIQRGASGDVVAKEAADVANFAMFIANQYRENAGKPG